MDTVFRGLAVYLFLLIIFRFIGRRTLSQTTTFDLVLLLIISEATQQAMIDSDNSMTNAALLIVTLALASLGFSLLKEHSPVVERWLEGTPIPIVHDGRLKRDRMEDLRVDMDDILEAARSTHGLERLDQVKCAIVERNGEITIIPRDQGA